MKTPHAVRPNSVKGTLASSALGRDGQPLIRDSQPAWEHSPAELVGIAAKFQPEVFMGHRYTSHTHTHPQLPTRVLPPAGDDPTSLQEGGESRPTLPGPVPGMHRALLGLPRSLLPTQPGLSETVLLSYLALSFRKPSSTTFPACLLNVHVVHGIDVIFFHLI